jgi:geranyl-CoA carboxylase alpha subunit
MGAAMKLSKILVANRGEIACRVMRTARRLGCRTVAVFSDADEHAPHVSLADEAIHIGASPAARSYLNIAAILDAAKLSGADALHPGYGFLSENADFAQACADAGLVFIGPPPEAIRAMGDKARAKQRMAEAGVPTVPGYLGGEQSDERLIAEAARLGYPLLVKAVAGGGGRGMRLVRRADELVAALAGARREALGAFGDGTLMLERLIEHARHIEVQVFADAHGNAVHLGERDCTTQRRRQKVIEEAPSPVVTPALRDAMGRDAVAAALAVGYRGAGTVEFIVDRELRHCFLEMNTRLQVEHAVTEAVTGLDLVEWQLRVAAGEPLPLTQEQIRFTGHAIEARLYAEDPAADFAPQSGRIVHWRPERALRDGVRIDSGIAEGGTVSPYYDAMVAKLIAHGRDRDDAIRRLCAALEDAPLLGVKNNGALLRELLSCEAFRGAVPHTGTLDEWAEQGDRASPAGDDAWCVAAALLARGNEGWRPASVAAFDIALRCDGTTRTPRVRLPLRDGATRVTLDGQARALRVLAQDHDSGELRFELDGLRRKAIARECGGTLHLALDGACFAFDEPSPIADDSAAHDARVARAPVAGVVTQVLVAPGDAVTTGQPLLCVEAMKMEMWLNARAAGTVLALRARMRDTVVAGAVLVELELTQGS